MDAISILAALDEHYLPQLHVLLTSLRLNNPGEHMDLYLLQSAVSPEGLAGVERLCAAFGYGFFPVRVDDALFQGAPVSRQYPKEMYYRLLASRLLPDTLDRVLYLDPDILVLNPCAPCGRPIWRATSLRRPPTRERQSWPTASTGCASTAAATTTTPACC